MQPKTVDEYLDGVDAERRAELERIRVLVKRLVPSAEETMSYGMPTLKHGGLALVYFTASKKHRSLFPSSWAIDELRDGLEGHTTTQHAIQFTLENPLADDLLEDMVRVHPRENDAGRE
ncbi:iron chaperone [Leucobacter soli]|nr:DUF1801 domain-containing protein [Leucobacter soli]